MCVDVILKRCDSFEPTIADITLVGTFFAVGFHVTSQEVALWRCVVTIVAHKLGLEKIN